MADGANGLTGEEIMEDARIWGTIEVGGRRMSMGGSAEGEASKGGASAGATEGEGRCPPGEG